jgi:MerR-like DNA binding protein
VTHEPAHAVPADLANRLVVALDPSPETRLIVARRIVEFADELADDVTLNDVVDAVENPPLIGAVELAARAGVSYRQVNHWTTEGYLSPVAESTGSGNPKNYPRSAIVKARIMGALVRNFTMRLDAAARVADEIIRTGTAHVGPFTVTRNGAA